MIRLKSTFLVVAALFAVIQASGQPPASGSAAVSDEVQALVTHLPDWQKVRAKATFVTDLGSLQGAAGDRPLLNVIDFDSGTEAATAPYKAGRLVLVEFTNPQASIDADQRVQANIAGISDVVYRRIGNYNAFVFDATDPAAANALLDQIKYEKQIQWVFGDQIGPTKAERDFTIGAASLFLSTFLAMLIGAVGAVALGAVLGFAYFRYREKERAALPSFSDAGGMVRLNLDDLTPNTRLLSE